MWATHTDCNVEPFGSLCVATRWGHPSVGSVEAVTCPVPVPVGSVLLYSVAAGSGGRPVPHSSAWCFSDSETHCDYSGAL